MRTGKAASEAKEQKIWPEQVIGGKFIRLLEKHMQALRSDDAHGNRDLFLDDVFVVYLLAFFNPTVRSLRTIEDFSQTVQVQKHLSLSKICKSTLSDFNKLVEPERLVPILTALRGQLGRKQAGHREPESDLESILKQTIAVDGTFVPAVAEVTWAIANSNSHGTSRHRARLDAHINVSSWLPEAIVVPDDGQSEADSAIAHILPGMIYIYDRAYMSYDLITAHYSKREEENETQHNQEQDPQSHFVIRFKAAGSNSPELTNAVERPLTDKDRAAGVISDRIGYFVSDSARRKGVSKIMLREVVIEFEEKGEKKRLRVITNLFDVSATTIGLLYRLRWQVELFFRWLKAFGNFGHLIAHGREGVLTHFYVTIIAITLMYLHTGHRPSKYMFALLSQVAVGAATLDEIIPILRERERRSELDRQSRARRAAAKKNS